MYSDNGDSRKRKLEEENDESLPISKRINRLCIGNDYSTYNLNGFTASSSAATSPCSPTPCLSGHQVNGFHGNMLPQHQPHHGSPSLNQPHQYNGYHPAPTQNHRGHSSGHPGGQLSEAKPYDPYEPDLDRASNPFYFDVNRVLYEAHMSRLHRTNSAHQTHK